MQCQRFGLDKHIPWERPGTAAAPTSPCIRRTPTKVELCLFDSADDDEGIEPHRRCPNTPTWSGTATCPTCCRARFTAIAFTGPTSRREGHRFNPNKVLLDPYAKAIARETRWADEMWGYQVGDPKADLSFDDRDNAKSGAAGRRRRRSLHLGRRPPAAHPWSKTIIYELHVKGFTMRHPDVPENFRGTYAGLGSDASIEYLKSLGVTAVELLPIHEFVDDRHLVERELMNYWGYNTLGFFAPDTATPRRPPARRGARIQDDGPQPARGRHRGHSRRGLQPHRRRKPSGADPLASAASTTPPITGSSPEDPRYYMDFTGCGNTLQHAQSAGAAIDHGQPALLGARTCTSTASASIWPARWPASCTKSTSWARFSTSSTRIR